MIMQQVWPKRSWIAGLAIMVGVFAGDATGQDATLTEATKAKENAAAAAAAACETKASTTSIRWYVEATYCLLKEWLAPIGDQLSAIQIGITSVQAACSQRAEAGLWRSFGDPFTNFGPAVLADSGFFYDHASAMSASDMPGNIFAARDHGVIPPERADSMITELSNAEIEYGLGGAHQVIAWRTVQRIVREIQDGYGVVRSRPDEGPITYHVLNGGTFRIPYQGELGTGPLTLLLFQYPSDATMHVSLPGGGVVGEVTFGASGGGVKSMQGWEAYLSLGGTLTYQTPYWVETDAGLVWGGVYTFTPGAPLPGACDYAYPCEGW